MEARLLFVGLWTIADRVGRLEDRPKQIKMEIFPADSVDIDALLNLIAATGMLQRYEVDGKRYLQVTSFAKHQNPHRDEKPSTIPDAQGNYAESVPVIPKHGANTVQAPCKPDAKTVAIVLNPESCSLIPDPLVGKPGAAKRRKQIPEDFEPNETGFKLAVEKGLFVVDEVQKFKDHHSAKGSVMLDWQAAWRTWVGNAKQFSQRFSTPPIAVTVPSKPGVDPALAKCIADRLVCKGPPPEIRSRLKQLSGARQ